MLIVLFIVILIIIILLIINQVASNIFDNLTFVKGDKFILEPYEFPDLQVKKIGICFSLNTRIPYKLYTICHEDILCYCSDGNWYLLAEIYDKDTITINSKTEHIIGIRKVDITKKFKHITFNYGGYKYTCFKLHNPSCYVDLKFVYNVFKDNFNIPYHILKNNCHHLCKHVMNVIADIKNSKDIVSEFELLKYINKTINEIFTGNFEE